MSRIRSLAVVLVAAAGFGCQALPPVLAEDGVVVDGWVFPTAAPLPEGAIALPLDASRPPSDAPSGVELGACPAALHEPVTLVVDRSSEPPMLTFLDDRGAIAPLRWSYGISARDIDGVAEVVLPDGQVIVREGERSRVILGGGYASNDDIFSVCLTAPHRLDPGAT
jgi:hypothetical protein